VTRSALAPLRSRLLLAIALIALAGIIAGGARQLHVQAGQRRQAAVTARHQNTALLEQAPAEAEERNRRLRLFDEWSRRGIVGGKEQGAREAADRFLDALFAAETVIDAHYEFLPPAESGASSQPVPGYREKRSLLKFRLELLHDGDLPYLFSALGEQAPAWTRARSCALRRNTAPEQENSGKRGEADAAFSAANLKLECLFDWIVFVPEH